MNMRRRVAISAEGGGGEQSVEQNASSTKAVKVSTPITLNGEQLIELAQRAAMLATVLSA